MLDLKAVDASLAEALEDNSYDQDWWLDPETGAVEPWSTDSGLWEDAEEEHPADRNWISVDPIGSREAYGDMEDFIDRVRNARARELLERAIAGRGAFRRFKDTLFEDPDLPELAGRFDADEIAGTVAADLGRLYGERLRKVLLFGSWARGDAHPESDIDLLVVLDRLESPRGRSSGGWTTSCGGTRSRTTRSSALSRSTKRSSPVLRRRW